MGGICRLFMRGIEGYNILLYFNVTLISHIRISDSPTNQRNGNGIIHAASQPCISRRP